MDKHIRPDIMAHATREGDTYLLNYRLLVRDLPELAGSWPDMEDEERLHHRLSSTQTWGMRCQLGDLYHAGQLTAEQEAEPAALDHELIQHLDGADLCYGLDLQSVAQLFTWGTPLALCNSVLHRAGPIRRGFVVSLWAEALKAEGSAERSSASRFVPAP